MEFPVISRKHKTKSIKHAKSSPIIGLFDTVVQILRTARVIRKLETAEPDLFQHIFQTQQTEDKVSKVLLSVFSISFVKTLCW